MNLLRLLPFSDLGEKGKGRGLEGRGGGVHGCVRPHMQRCRGRPAVGVDATWCLGRPGMPPEAERAVDVGGKRYLIHPASSRTLVFVHHEHQDSYTSFPDLHTARFMIESFCRHLISWVAHPSPDKKGGVASERQVYNCCWLVSTV